jgi:hypothetical protein
MPAKYGGQARGRQVLEGNAGSKVPPVTHFWALATQSECPAPWLRHATAENALRRPIRAQGIEKS